MSLMMRHAPTNMLPAGKKALPVQTALQHVPVRIRRISAIHEGTRVRKRGPCLGTDPDGDVTYLKPKHLRTHLHIIGPTGQGKSRLLLWLFQLLCYTGRPIILVDPKGDLFQQCRNWAMMNGFKKRLVLFDLSSDMLPGYNPLRENGLRVDLQAQWVRESIRSAWGSSTFDATPLLARMLYLCLYVARAMKVTLMDALDVLRPTPYLRQRALQEITDPFIHQALLAYDNLSDRLKVEQSSSTVSRLEMFVCDEIVRKVICSPTSIDTEQVLAERKIWLVNAAKCQPVMEDPIKMLLRFLSNDILAHIYKGHGEGRFDEDKPVYFIADEFQNMATPQWATALDEGRGLGLHCILAHQHLSQLAQEDKSGYLLQSCMNDARTKIIFGGLAPQDLQVFADMLMLDHFDPWMIKHIQRNPVFAPVESVRRVVSESLSESDAASVTDNFSKAESASHSVNQSVSRGRSVTNSFAETEGEQESYTFGKNSSITDSHTSGTADTVSGAHTTGTAVSHGRSRGSGLSTGDTDSRSTNSASGWSQSDARSSATITGSGESMLAPEEHFLWTENPELVGVSTHTSSTDGRSFSSGKSGMSGSSAGQAHSRVRSSTEAEMNSSSVSSSDTKGWSSTVQESDGIAYQRGTSEAWSRGRNRSTTRGTALTLSDQETNGTSDTIGHTSTRGGAITAGKTHTRGTSVTMTPFYEYRREENETPVFMTPEEQKLLVQQRLYRIPQMHFLVKAPESPDCIIRAPFVPDPIITKRQLIAGLDFVHSAEPFYTPLNQRDHVAPSVGDVIDVEVLRDVLTPEQVKEVPSPETTDAEREAALWEKWVPGSSRRRGRQ